MWNVATGVLGTNAWLLLALLPVLSGSSRGWREVVACSPALVVLVLGLRPRSWIGWHVALFPALLALPWAVGGATSLDRATQGPLRLTLQVLALGSFVAFAVGRPWATDLWSPRAVAPSAHASRPALAAFRRWAGALVLLGGLAGALAVCSFAPAALGSLQAAFPGHLRAARVGLTLAALLSWIVLAAAAAPTLSTAGRSGHVWGTAAALLLTGGGTVALCAALLELALLHPLRAGALFALALAATWGGARVGSGLPQRQRQAPGTSMVE